MIAEDVPAALHQVTQHFTARAGRQVAGNGFIGDVVRRLRLGLGAERSFVFGPVDENVAITDAGVELERWAAERLLHRCDQCLAIIVRDVPGGEIAHLFVFDR